MTDRRNEVGRGGGGGLNLQNRFFFFFFPERNVTQCVVGHVT